MGEQADRPKLTQGRNLSRIQGHMGLEGRRAVLKRSVPRHRPAVLHERGTTEPPLVLGTASLGPCFLSLTALPWGTPMGLLPQGLSWSDMFWATP